MGLPNTPQAAPGCSFCSRKFHLVGHVPRYVVLPETSFTRTRSKYILSYPILHVMKIISRKDQKGKTAWGRAGRPASKEPHAQQTCTDTRKHVSDMHTYKRVLISFSSPSPPSLSSFLLANSLQLSGGTADHSPPKDSPHPPTAQPPPRSRGSLLRWPSAPRSPALDIARRRKMKKPRRGVFLLQELFSQWGRGGACSNSRPPRTSSRRR